MFDRNSDVIFAVGGAILELAWDSTTGRYATTPTTVASLSGVDGLAIDPSGDLFAADYGNGDVYELAWNGTQFGAPEDLASVGSGLVDVAVNPANDDLLLTPSGDGEVDEMVWNASTDSYGAPTALLTGLDNPAGLFVGQHDDLFVTEYQGGAIVEYPWNTSTASYGAQVSVASSLGYENPNFVVQDSDGNLFFDETQNGSVDEIPWSGSSFGSPETVYGPLTQPLGVGIDDANDVFVGASNLVELVNPPTSQAITFTSSPPQEVAGSTSTYTVTATGGASGEPVTFSIDPSSTAGCTISGSVVSFSPTGTGDCEIDANQGALPGYSPAAEAHQFVTVTAPPVTTRTTTPPASSTTTSPTVATTTTAPSAPATTVVSPVVPNSPPAPMPEGRVVASRGIQTVRNHASALAVAMSCETASCSGTAQVSVARHAGDSWRHLVLATAPVHLAPGQREMVVFSVTPTGRSVLAKHAAYWTRRQGRYRMTLTTRVGGTVGHASVYIRVR